MLSIKNIEKYSKGFILKCIQVIVGSRLGKKVVKKGNHSKNDWFHIAISDLSEVEENSLKCLDHLLFHLEGETNTTPSFTISARWKICCEISIQTSDRESMTLEYWLFENCPFKESTPGSPISNSYSFHFSNIYERMGVLLKSILTLTRATPAFNISSKGQSEHSHVICYRIYQCGFKFDQLLQQSGVDESEIKQHYTSEIKLGSIKTLHNRINVSFCYRTDMTRCRKINEFNDNLLPLKNDHFTAEAIGNQENKDNKKLFAAFASSTLEASLPLLPDAPFNSLLTKGDLMSSLKDESNGVKKTSKPISIPEVRRPKIDDNNLELVDNSSIDSFVFVENKAPFAPENDNDVGSFFNGPTPSFHCKSILDELTDIANKLAVIESSATQWDTFVDSVCLPNGEDEEA